MMAHTQVDSPQWLAKATELKETVLKRLEETPEPLRLKLPSKDAWSAAEVVEHLIVVEECVAGPWRESLARERSVKLGVKSRFVTRMVSTIFGQTGMRVPTVPELVPKGDLSLPELERRWQEARKDLVAALPEDPDVAWIMHPALGPLSSSQMGAILAAHLKLHLRHWPTIIS